MRPTLPRAVRSTLRDVLTSPDLRGPSLFAAIESIGGDGSGIEPFRACLELFSGTATSEEDARQAIEAVEAHRERLESRLLRDPGFVVAAADALPHRSVGFAADRLSRAAERGDSCLDFDSRFASELRRAARTGRAVTLILAAPDADAGLDWPGVVAALREAARDVDWIARCLPEGIVALLPCTASAEGVQAASRLCGVATRVSGAAWFVGVAAAPESGHEPVVVAAAARTALARARREGPGAVRLASGDRRRHGRHVPRIDLKARVGPQDRSAPADVEDLSLGGALVRSPRPLVPGLRVELTLGDDPPRARRLALPATVVRAEAPPPGSRGSWRAALRFDPERVPVPLLAGLLATRHEGGGT